MVCDAETAEGKITVTFAEKEITVQKPADVLMYFERGCEADTKIKVCDNRLELTHNSFDYTADFTCALTETAKGYELGKGEVSVKIMF